MPTNVYDNTYPPDTQLANLIGQDLRAVALNVQERMAYISGNLSTRWNPGADAQPLAWTGLLFFSLDTKQIFYWGGAAWFDVTLDFPSTVITKLDYPVSGGSIASGVFFTTTRAGVYRITADIVVSTAGTSGAITPVIGWNNGVASLTANLGSAAVTPAGVETPISALNMYVAAGQNITVATNFVGTAGALQYTLRVRLEYLG